MKNFIFILLSLFALSGCGTMKKASSSFKNSTDSTGTLNASTTTKLSDIKDTKQTTTEKIDSPLFVRGDSISGQKSVSDITNGSDLIADNGTTKITVTYDKASNSLRATATEKPRTIDAKFSKQTTTIAHESTSDVTQATQKQKATVKTATDQKTATKTRTGLSVLTQIGIGLILLVLVLLVLAYRYRKQIFGLSA